MRDFKRQIKDLIASNNPINLWRESKRVQVDNQRVGWEEGVVHVRAMSNGLVAVVYTTGMLKVWSAKTNKEIVAYDLVNANNTEKIVAAKIEALAHPYSYEDHSKLFELTVSFATQSFKTYHSHWQVA